MLLLSWQLAVSIDFSPLMKVPKAAVLAHRVGLSNTLRIRTAIIFGVECKHSAMAESPAARQEGQQRCGLDFTRLAQHHQGVPFLPVPGSMGGGGISKHNAQ